MDYQRTVKMTEIGCPMRTPGLEQSLAAGQRGDSVSAVQCQHAQRFAVSTKTLQGLVPLALNRP